MKENKSDHFKRIAEFRVKNILHQLKVLGNCSSKSFYSYDKEQIRKITGVIIGELRETANRFTFPEDMNFKL